MSYKCKKNTQLQQLNYGLLSSICSLALFPLFAFFLAHFCNCSCETIIDCQSMERNNTNGEMDDQKRNKTKSTRELKLIFATDLRKKLQGQKDIWITMVTNKRCCKSTKINVITLISVICTSDNLRKRCKSLSPKCTQRQHITWKRQQLQLVP